jgi:DNA primase
VPTAQGLVRFERELDGEVRIVALPAGRDPDEVIRADAAQWESLIAAAVPVIEYVLRSLAQETDLSSAKGKSEAAERVLPLLAEIHNPIERAHYVQRLAHILDVDERAIGAQIRGPAQQGRETRPRGRPAPTPPPEIPLLGRKQELVEGYLVALLYRFPQLWSFLPAGAESLLSQEEHRTLLALLPSGAALAPDTLPGELRIYLDSLQDHFRAELRLDDDTAQRALGAILSRLESLANARQSREYQDVLAQAQDEGNRELAQEVVRHLSDLGQRRWKISMPPLRRLYPDARRYLGEEGDGPVEEGRSR